MLAAGTVRLLEDEDVAAGDRAAHAVHGEAREDVGLLVGAAGQLRQRLEVRFERVVIGVGDVEGEDVGARGGKRPERVAEVAPLGQVRPRHAADGAEAPAVPRGRRGCGSGLGVDARAGRITRIPLTGTPG